jgi:hypothetical protein
MRPLKSLTFEAFRNLLAKAFKEIPDNRDPKRLTWVMPAVLMGAFAMFFFQHPNLLEYQRRMKKKTGRSNLERIFEVEDIPSDTQMREILDGAPIEPLRRVLPETFERMRRVGWTVRFVTAVNGEKYYTVALDGSEYFHSTKLSCPGCLHHKSADGETRYSHVVVAATLVRAGSHDFVEVWQRNPAGKVIYHNSWVTDFEVTRENVATIIGIGRSRWKIENEQFNVHKNHGYELEHNYGHGQQTLSMVFYLLNLLAFLAHKVLEFGDRLYQQCRAGESRRGLWTMLRSAFYLVEVESWEGLLLNHLSDEARSP